MRGGGYKRPSPVSRAPLSDRKMIQLLVVVAVLLGGYLVLTKTLFRRSKCKGNAPMAGKTVVITGE